MKDKGVTLWLNENLMEALNKYRKNMGWTWKRMFLYGVAMTIQDKGKNEDLLIEIANYLENNR